jgi:hypothetical protein
MYAHEKIVQMLVDRGADIHTQEEEYGDILQATSSGGLYCLPQIVLQIDYGEWRITA